MRPVKGLGLLAALTMALGLVAVQPAVAPAANRVEAASSAQLAIRNLAYANLGISACQVNSQGRWYFTAPDGASSCSYPNSWCGMFAGWAWWKSGHVYLTDKKNVPLGHTPTSFETYGSNNVKAGMTDGLRYATNKVPPAEGDVVIFRSGSPATPGHVAIVYSVNKSSGQVVTVAGNEPGSTNSYVGLRIFNYLSPNTRSTPTTATYYPYEYIKALIH